MLRVNIKYYVRLFLSGDHTNSSQSFELMIFGRPALQCPGQSCEGRCNMSADGKVLCSCDELCRQLGDCCVDAHIHCFGAKPGETHMLLPLPEDVNPFVLNAVSSMECQQLILMESTYKDGPSKTVLRGYFLISSCPVDNADDECSEISSDATHSIPVCLPQFDLLFRNIYCLICHGFSPEEAVAFTFNVPDCVDWLDELNSTSFVRSATSADAVWNACGILGFSSVSKGCEATTKRMLCLPGDQTTEQKCPAYSNPVVTDENGLIYKNQFCVPTEDINISCLEYDDYGHSAPNYIAGDFLLSITILLDFSSGYPTSTVEISNKNGNDKLHKNGNDQLRLISNGSMQTSTLVQVLLMLAFFVTALEMIFQKVSHWLFGCRISEDIYIM